MCDWYFCVIYSNLVEWIWSSLFTEHKKIAAEAKTLSHSYMNKSLYVSMMIKVTWCNSIPPFSPNQLLYKTSALHYNILLIRICIKRSHFILTSFVICFSRSYWTLIISQCVYSYYHKFINRHCADYLFQKLYCWSTNWLPSNKQAQIQSRMQSDAIIDKI